MNVFVFRVIFHVSVGDRLVKCSIHSSDLNFFIDILHQGYSEQWYKRQGYTVDARLLWRICAARNLCCCSSVQRISRLCYSSWRSLLWISVYVFWSSLWNVQHVQFAGDIPIPYQRWHHIAVKYILNIWGQDVAWIAKVVAIIHLRDDDWWTS